jgi:hypothetical protein
MKTKKLSLSQKLDIVYELATNLGELVSRQEEELKTIRLQLVTQSERIQQLEAIIKEMPTQKLNK